MTDKKYDSPVDRLADQLSLKIGATVRVHRLDPDRDRIGREKVGRYRIVVEDMVDGQPLGISSGDLKVAEAKKFLAFINDLIDFGLLKMNRTDSSGQFEMIDGVGYVWDDADPDTRYEVVSMLDGDGEETDDEDLMAGGIFKVGDVFRVFLL